MVTMHGISISFSFSRERVRTYMRNPKKQVDVQADSRDWDWPGETFEKRWKKKIIVISFIPWKSLL